jgi:hypothetical protein
VFLVEVVVAEEAGEAGLVVIEQLRLWVEGRGEIEMRGVRRFMALRRRRRLGGFLRGMLLRARVLRTRRCFVGVVAYL